jgi:Protein of unknown function (DUF2489)
MDRDKSHSKAAVAIAAHIIAGKLGLLEGCAKLYSLSFNVVPDWRVDKDFVVFGAVASETDHLPYGAGREYWNAAALSREDIKIAQYEGRHREEIIAACRNVITRFGDA